VIGFTYALSVVHAVALGRLPYVAQVHAQAIGDLLVITWLVYLTGGTRTGFILLYPLPVLVGSVLLLRGRGFTLAGLATLFYAALLLAVHRGLVPAQGLVEVVFLPGKQVIYSIFVTGVVCVSVAMIGSYLSQNLRTVGERLEETSEQVAGLQELNKVIIDSIQSGLAICDAGGRVLYVNAFGEAILGRRGPELSGATLSEVFGRPLLGPQAPGLGGHRKRLTRLEISYSRPDGEGLDLGISVSPLATSGPGQDGHLLVFQDLTSIKRLEEELRLKDKLAAVGEVTAQLAHEIRNPLGSISGSAQVLMADPGISGEQERLLRIIKRESKRLSDTLSRVLLEVRPARRSREPVDLGPVVSEAMTLLRNAPEVGPAHEVVFEGDRGPHVCLADRDQIAQVFWNLARNGLEAMPHGGELRVSLRRTDDEVLLAVRDQGRGIPNERRRRIFAPFQSGSSLGAGLGLAIVYRIVREHRGDIQLSSDAASGTEVVVRLPVAGAEQLA